MPTHSGHLSPSSLTSWPRIFAVEGPAGPWGQAAPSSTSAHLAVSPGSLGTGMLSRTVASLIGCSGALPGTCLAHIGTHPECLLKAETQAGRPQG